ncbi:hypothetical protein RHSIM_RhsimUnG0209000 [Rhododendron simsii]|uniref:Uncharacterized protein n=1 Tax=Rhododendron simsii TaxID=118357 RepID=A0A834L3Z1_RHOSS|nr:hypothetical protein RHSIM_RhsimUnG0209000 [Rhododendron simsii]
MPGFTGIAYCQLIQLLDLGFALAWPPQPVCGVPGKAIAPVDQPWWQGDRHCSRQHAKSHGQGIAHSIMRQGISMPADSLSRIGKALLTCMPRPRVHQRHCSRKAIKANTRHGKPIACHRARQGIAHGKAIKAKAWQADCCQRGRQCIAHGIPRPRVANA